VESETEILRRRLAWKRDDPTKDLKPVVDGEGFRQMQEEVEEKIYVHPALLVYISRLVRGVREHPHVSAGPSPRGALSLLRLARANAYVSGRNFVTPDDVKIYVEDSLAHRIILDVE